MDIIKKLFNMTESALSIEKLNGGYTNNVYKVTLIEKNLTYIVRIYGKNLSQLINRDNELQMIKYLNTYSIGPKIISIHDDCRIEQFLPGITLADTPSPASRQYTLGAYLKHLHTIPLNSILPLFWTKFYEWKCLTGDIYNEQITDVVSQINNMEDNFWNQNVVGHGDLTLGNILVHNKEINLIDFEYSCVLPRGFELGNHLCEHDGFNYEINVDGHSYPEHNVWINLLKGYSSNYTEEDIKIIKKYTLVSHYYWGCWAQIQSQNSEIDFSYEKYSQYRFKLFLKYYDK